MVSGPPNLNAEIRRIAQQLVGQAITDSQITTVAKAAGCAVPVVGTLDSLQFTQRIALAKYILDEQRKKDERL